MNSRKLSTLTGISYLIIFFTAIYANFFMLEALKENPLETILHQQLVVRTGILAFLITVVFDVVVAWGLFELYKKHLLTRLSTYFRLMHAAIMAVAIFALVLSLSSVSGEEVTQRVNTFEIIWLIGLFFFGAHLILLARIIERPRWIALFILLAGIMYMVDTGAHFLLPNYTDYADLFLALVAIPSIFGEMAFTVWLLVKGGKKL
ncbi:DUF4386 domain-containing protein [uncultured Draconibacterium sp.]|uniref:DUF4386 domain-containing protein n=1 Tax=uncultured Draconibacterium sp. TaxID=1573823 RepID=UPI00325FEC9D